jgi:hypothetical protein
VEEESMILRETFRSLKFWQRILITPFLALAIVYWFALMGICFVMAYPAIWFINKFNLAPGLPQTPKQPPVTRFDRNIN